MALSYPTQTGLGVLAYVIIVRYYVTYKSLK